MGIPAVVAAGDRRAAKAVCGESKVYLEIEGRPLVAHVVVVLQRVTEVSEVWVVGDAERLREVFRRPEIRQEIHKPLHLLPQFRNLYENAWESYRRLLPGAGAAGRDPNRDDADVEVLYLSADIPFATPQEVSDFVRRGLALQSDYVMGLTTEEAMQGFYPTAPGEPGIRMAYVNLREGRFRQTNLHLVKPARITNRFYIEEMYEHRYQRQVGQAITLAWRLLRTEEGGLKVLAYYFLIHLAAFADRHGWRRLADRLRHGISLERVAKALSSLLRSSFRFVITEAGGCAVDIDNEPDYDAARARFKQWRDHQEDKAEALYGRAALASPGEREAR
jgi:CTP:molybdopterin cytidylyltransferase MocA